MSFQAEMIPSDAVIVDAGGEWKIIIKVGETGIAQYGGIQVYIPVGWTMPQFNKVDQPGHAQISVQSREPVEWKSAIYSCRWIGVELVRGELHSGDAIQITYRGHAPRVPVSQSEFTVSVDTQGYFIYQKLPVSPALQVTSGKIAAFQVTATASVAAGANFQIGITAVDALGSWVEDYEGVVTVMFTAGSPDAQTPLGVCKVKRGLGTFEADGQYGDAKRIAVMGQDGPFRGESNPFQTVAPDEYKLFFGDIHGHSSFSDGRFAPETYYQYARDVSRLDFCAVSDHDNVGSNSNVEEHSKVLIDSAWRELKKITNRFNQPGIFTTLVGFEYTNTEIEVGGHRNVYFSVDDPPLFRSWDPATNTPAKLFDALHQLNVPVLVIPHHPLHFMGWEHDPELQRLFEIYSMWGLSEIANDDCAFSHPVKYHHGGFSFRDALARGYRLGVTGGGDNHDSLPGIRYGTDPWRKGKMAQRPGLVAVYAKENTREAIFEALWNRRCYGTTGIRPFLDFRLNGAWMGSELGWSEARELTLAVRGEDRLERVEIIKNGAIVYEKVLEGYEADLVWQDVSASHQDDYYYLRVRQQNGERAWSSPIWINARP
jgi:hypothetical protein